MLTMRFSYRRVISAGTQAKKSGQDDEVDLVFLQFVQDFSAVQILPGEDYGGYGIFGGTFQYAGTRVVRKDQGDVRRIGLAEVVDEVFCIGAQEPEAKTAIRFIFFWLESTN